MELLLGLAPFAVLLACPLMMGACALKMRRNGCSTTDAAQQAGARVAPAASIAALRVDLARVQREQSAIAAQLSELERAETAIAAEQPALTAAAVRSGA